MTLKNTKEESLFVQLFLCPHYYHYLDRKAATVVKRNIKMSQMTIAKVFLKVQIIKILQKAPCVSKESSSSAKVCQRGNKIELHFFILFSLPQTTERE